RFKMKEYKLKTPKRVEETVVGAYKKIETAAVDTYKKVEKKFVDTFLEEVPASEEGKNTQTQTKI
ncbi:MAG: hypothetical protein ACI4LB_06765, partial [Candidatus Fimenecus sp.]